MPKYQFLTPEWIEEAKKIREQFDSDAVATPHVVRMNQVITEVPSATARSRPTWTLTSGEVKMDLGYLESPDHRHHRLCDRQGDHRRGQPAGRHAGLQAAGRVKVQGDMTADGHAAARRRPGRHRGQGQQAIQEITEQPLGVRPEPAAAGTRAVTVRVVVGCRSAPGPRVANSDSTTPAPATAAPTK